jgi:hypothetical protein
MKGISFFLGRYVWAPIDMLQKGGVLSLVLVTIWVLYPFVLQTLIHPTDAVGFQAWVQGLPISRYVSRQAIFAGEITTLIVLVALGLLQLGVVVLLYRRLGYRFSVWPLALVLIGGVANGIWWWRTGYLDLRGASAGLSPLVLAAVCQGACEKLGQEFVFGKNARPSMSGVR